MKTVFFLSLLFTAFATAGGLAHSFELLNKINLPAEQYLVVQQIYRGWALLGIVVFGSLGSILALTIMVRRDRRLFPLTLTALLCIVGTQIIFWRFTFPVNQETRNWTVLPDNWLQLRNQWEYSHLASAGLDVVALVMLYLAVLTTTDLQRGRGR
ncbi:MAG: DUF1772 domain-containing protein [Bryobacteraceae bacterium]